MLNRFALGLLLALGSLTTLWGQNQVTVKGTVTDALNGEPLAFVTVVVVGQATGALTDYNGDYVVRAKPQDSLVLEFSYIQYQTKRLTLAVPAGTTTLDGQDVKLDPKATEEVRIEGVAKIEQDINDVAISTTTIGTKQVDIQASTNLQSAVEQVPGVSVFDRQLSIRGSSGYTYGAGTRVLTLLDGLPMLTANRGSAQFDMLPNDNIAQIEVIKGASSVLYGTGAMGGIINVRTAAPTNTPKTSVRVVSRYFDAPGLDSADWDGRSAAIQPSLHLFHSRKIKNRLDLTVQLDFMQSSGVRREESSRRFRGNIMTKAYSNIRGKDGKFLGTLTYGLNAMANFDTGASVLIWAGYPVGALEPGPGFLSYQWLERYSVDPHVTFLTAKGNSHNYRGRIFYEVDRISTGQNSDGLIQYHDYNYVHNWGKNKAVQLTTIFGGNYTGTSIDAPGTFGTPVSHQFGPYAQAELGLLRDKSMDKLDYKLNLSFGARYQYEQIFARRSNFSDTVLPAQDADTNFTTMNRPVVRVGANYRFAEASWVRASIGQGLRSPSVAERFTRSSAGGIFVNPNPGIEVERGYTAEVGLRQLYAWGDMERDRFAIQGFVDVAAFTMQFRDMVEFLLDLEALQNPTPGSNALVFFKATNISSASISGAEVAFQADARLGEVRVAINGGMTFIDPINHDGLAELDTIESGLAVVNPGAFGVVTDPNAPGFDAERLNAYTFDQPRTLKYRSRWLWRGGLTVAWQGLSVTANHRYQSEVVTIDKLFNLAIPGSVRARNELNRAYHILDLVLAYTVKARKTESTVSLHAFNATNTTFLAIPGRLGDQRSWALQYKLTF